MLRQGHKSDKVMPSSFDILSPQLFATTCSSNNLTIRTREPQKHNRHTDTDNQSPLKSLTWILAREFKPYLAIPHTISFWDLTRRKPRKSPQPAKHQNPPSTIPKQCSTSAKGKLQHRNATSAQHASQAT